MWATTISLDYCVCMRKRRINRLLFSVQSLQVFCFYEQTLKPPFLPACQEERKIGIVSLHLHQDPESALGKYGSAGPLPTHKHYWLGLFNPFQTQPSCTLTIQSKGTSCPFPALPKLQNKSPFLSVDVTKWSVPREAVWQGGLDSKSLAFAL